VAIATQISKLYVMLEKYYKINNTFYSIVIETEYEYRIKFGGKHECINISVYKDDTNANLNGLSYDERCNKTSNLIPGDGTINMLKCALKFAHTLYPQHMHGILLNDHSSITCAENIKIPLFYYYMTKHGKTWYQSKFNAQSYVKEYKKYIKDALEYMKKDDNKLPWNKFYDKYFIGCRVKYLKSEFEEIYESSRSYHEFI
jgi:hypothetical protein